MQYLNFCSKNSIFVLSNLKHSFIYYFIIFFIKKNILNDSTLYNNFISFEEKT